MPIDQKVVNQKLTFLTLRTEQYILSSSCLILTQICFQFFKRIFVNWKGKYAETQLEAKRKIFHLRSPNGCDAGNQELYSDLPCGRKMAFWEYVK